jgi:hypothetical protein
MKNKKVLYGILGLGAITGLYFWNKNKKGNNTISSEVVVDNSKKSVFTAEEVDKLAKEFSDELITLAEKEIVELELQPILKESIVDTNDRTLILNSALLNYNTNMVNREKAGKINMLKGLSKSYGNIYKMFKNSIPNFDNLNDLIMAKNIFLKKLILGDSKARNMVTKEEQIFLAEAESNKAVMKYPETIGFDTKLLPILSSNQIKTAM